MSPSWPCAVYPCDQPAEFEVATAGTRRLGERWVLCLDDLTRQMAWLIARDEAWGLNPKPVTVTELPVPSEEG